MRIWHKDLIEALPKQQLLGQWRECCLIMKKISEKGSPNHLLVNKIMNYPISHFYTYTFIVHNEMIKRGYNSDFNKFMQYFYDLPKLIAYTQLFHGWHNHRYLRQCFFNLQEKYDCGGIPEKEYNKLNEFFGYLKY